MPQQKPIYLDENGNPIKLDENGNPIKSIPHPISPTVEPDTRSGLSKFWDKINAPLSTLPSRIASTVAEPLMQFGESGNEWYRLPALYGGAYLQSLGDVTSGLTSPLNMGMAAVTGGTSMAARAGLPTTAKVLNYTDKALSTGVAAHGAQTILDSDKTLDERLLGAVELVGGGFGMRNKVPQIGKKIADGTPIPPTKIKGEYTPHPDDLVVAQAKEIIELYEGEVPLGLTDAEIIAKADAISPGTLPKKNTPQEAADILTKEGEVLSPPVNIAPKFGQTADLSPMQRGNLTKIAVKKPNDDILRMLEQEGFSTTGEVNAKGHLVFRKTDESSNLPVRNELADDIKLIQERGEFQTPELMQDPNWVKSYAHYLRTGEELNPVVDANYIKELNDLKSVIESKREAIANDPDAVTARQTLEDIDRVAPEPFIPQDLDRMPNVTPRNIKSADEPAFNRVNPEKHGFTPIQKVGDPELDDAIDAFEKYQEKAFNEGLTPREGRTFESIGSFIENHPLAENIKTQWKSNFEHARGYADTLSPKEFERIISKGYRRGFGPRADEVQRSASFDPTGGETPAKFTRANTDPRWVEAEGYAKELGIDPLKFDKIEDLDRAIKEKVTEIVLRTGRSPFRLPRDIQHASAGEGRIKIGADVTSLGKVLGSSLYEGDIATISTKELLQNSLDIIRPLGKDGKIKVDIDPKNYTIHVEDNGRGLTKAELETVFTDLGASGKRSDETAIGGFGLAKAAPLLGGESVYVSSTALDNGKLITTSFEGTPDDLLAGVELFQEIASPGTATGTVVRVKVPDTADFWDAKELVSNVGKYSKFEGTIEMRSPYTGNYKPIDKIAGRGEKTIVELDTPSAKTRLIEPSDSKRSERSFIELILSNKGMYQAKQMHYLPQNFPDIPERIIVDIDSKVPEGHGDYPFTANREKLRGTVQSEVEAYISDNIIRPSLDKRQGLLRELYNGMTEVRVPNGRAISFYDTGKKFTPQEFKAITENEVIQELGAQISAVIDEALLAIDNPVWTESLEKTGIIFDEKLKGIWIPNPEGGKSAILINPLTHMTHADSPDGAAAGFVHTILHEIAHIEPGASGHNESFTIRLSEIYSKFGARRTVRGQDDFLTAVTDRNTGEYTSEVQDILRRYQESRGRAITKEDALTRTGTQSAINKGRTGNIPKGDKPDGKGTTLGDTFYLKDPSIPNLKKALEQGYKSSGEIRSDGAIKMVKVTPTKAPILETDIKNIRATRGHLPAGQLGPKADVKRSSNVAEAFNLSRGLMAAIDFSAPMRQGLGLIHKKGWWTAWGSMFKSWGSETAFRAVQDSIAARPMFRQRQVGVDKNGKPKYIKSFADEAGLKLTDLTDLTKREEAIMSTWAEKVPGVRMSNRAYTAFLNKLRADTFEDLITKGAVFGADGKANIPLARAIADFVNTSTGRGSLDFGKLGDQRINLESSAVALNTMFFSPRLISSRLKMLNPAYYIMAPSFVRKEALKSLFAIAAAGNVITQLGQLAGGEVSNNPNSSDFGKLKMGNIRIDPYGGFQQYIVAANRLLRPNSAAIPGIKDTNTGFGAFDTTMGYLGTGGQRFTSSVNPNKTTDLSNPRTPFDPTHLSTSLRFGRGKLNPVLGFAWSLADKKREMSGQPMNFTTFNPMDNSITNRFIPILMQDVYELAKEDPTLIPLAIPAGIGIGVQSYNKDNWRDR